MWNEHNNVITEIFYEILRSLELWWCLELWRIRVSINKCPNVAGATYKILVSEEKLKKQKEKLEIHYFYYAVIKYILYS
jgi:hypothetical protein